MQKTPKLVAHRDGLPMHHEWLGDLAPCPPLSLLWNGWKWYFKSVKLCRRHFFGGHIQGKELVVLSDPGWNPAACQMDDRVSGFWHPMPYSLHRISFPSFREETAMGSPCNCDYGVPALVDPDLLLLGLLQWIAKTVLHEWGGCHGPSAFVISAAVDYPELQHSATGLLHITHRHRIQHMGATFPTVVTHFTICECLSRLISWDSLVQDYVFLLNGKQVGIEPLRVRNGFSVVVLPSSQASDRLCLASLCLPWWHWRVTLNELVLLTVSVHWPHGWPLRGGTAILFQVLPSGFPNYL